MTEFPHSPDLPELREEPADPGRASIDVNGIRTTFTGAPLSPNSILIDESEITGLAITSERVNELTLSDAILHDCDFSNVASRQGRIRRTRLDQSRFVGFSFEDGSIRDLSV